MLMLNNLAGFGARRASASAFDPISLFASGEQGAWFDPSDLTTMFQDSAGTTPVTADGQPVGLILDKSGRSNHASASADAKRPLYKTSGGLHWLQGDGVNDMLVSDDIDMTGSQSASLFIGFRKTDGAFYQTIAMRSTIASEESSGTMQLFSQFEFESSRFDFYGSAGNTEILKSGSVVPSSNVATGLSNLAAGNASFRLNGVLVNTNSFTAGGNMGDHSTSMFAAVATGYPASGNIHSMILLDRLPTAQEITDTEAWVAAKTGVTLP